MLEQFGGSWSDCSRVHCCVKKVQLEHLVQIMRVVRGYCEEVLAFNLFFLIMSVCFLCVDLCEKNFPKSAKTCHYVENLLKSKYL